MLASLLGSNTAVAQTGTYEDVAGDVYYSQPVAELAAEGVFAGTVCADGFCPGEPIDRETMAVWTVRVLDGADPPAVTETRFNDVDAASFHAPFIERMAELGVTTGCGDGSGYCPDRVVTRAQMAVFLSRAYKLAEGPDPGFSDVPADAWYAPAVAKLAASGITAGCGDGTGFCPSRDTTRAQMATFLWRAENSADAASEPELDESTHMDLSPYSPGQIVAASELWPDDGFPADYVCQFYPDGDIDDDDGNFNCWYRDWTPPAAQVLPEVVALCGTDGTTWVVGACTPPGTWATGTYSPDRLSYEVPRAVDGLAEFLDACNAVRDAPCRSMLSRMKWPIDYLGARPSCVLHEYTRRLEHFARTKDFASGSASERFGWHNCVTAIDPPAAGAALTDDGNDIGVRLSDTEATLAERCRLVLPEDVQLETKFNRVFTRFEAGHAGCDAWAAWIEEAIATPRRGVSEEPTCWRSVNLAQEWMEHHHDVPEDYFGFFGC